MVKLTLVLYDDTLAKALFQLPLKGDSTAQCITRICMVKSVSRPSYCTGFLMSVS